MIILDFQGPNAVDATYLLKKMPGKGFTREDNLDFSGFYENSDQKHTRFVLWNHLEPKAFLASRSRALSLEGYADPTGQCVDRYWLSQAEPCLGELLKDKQTHNIADQTLQVSLEFPAILLHHVPRLMEAFKELGWNVDVLSLATQHGFQELLNTELAAGVYKLTLTHTGKPAELFKQAFLLVTCFAQGPKYKPSEDQVTKLLRLGGNWLGKLTARHMIVGFYLQNDQRLCSHAAKLLGTTEKALRTETEEPPFDLSTFLTNWVKEGMEKEAEFPANITLNRRVLNGILNSMLHTVRAAKAENNPFDQENDPIAHQFWTHKQPETLVQYGLSLYNQRTKGLHTQRHEWIIKQINAPNALLELGANDGRCSESLFKVFPKIEDLALVDQDDFLLLRAEERLSRQGSKAHKCYVSNLMYADPRWLQPRFQEEWNAVILCEVIEHLSPEQLEMAMRTLGTQVKTKQIILTTPNRAWNPVLMEEVTSRHDDHQFEWTVEEATKWCEAFCARYNYTFKLDTIGRVLQELGSPSIGIIFSKKGN